MAAALSYALRVCRHKNLCCNSNFTTVRWFSASINQKSKLADENLKRRDEKLHQFIIKPVFYTPDEWDAIKSTSLAEGIVNDFAFPGYTMKLCLSEKNVTTAKSLIEYLHHKNITPNLTTLSLFLKLCSETYDETNEKLIIQIFNELRTRNSEYNVDVLSACICGLSRTKSWKKTIELLKIIEENNNKPAADAYNAVAWAAFKNKEFELGYNTVLGLKENKIRASVEVIDEWINFCENDNNLLKMEQLIDYLYLTMLMIPSNTSKKIKNFFEKRDFRVESVSIPPTGYCDHCGNSLEKIVLSEKDFKELRDAMMKRVLEGEDTFQKSHPLELERFIKFVEDTAPYDVVLDSLNIAYHQKAKTKLAKAEQVLKVVRYLTETKHLKVLVVGKREMVKWPRGFMDYIKKSSHYFITDILSEDDPFLLYAALASGPGTFVVSCDMMRDHKFCLQDEYLSSLFIKWQLSHQMSFVKYQADFKLVPPVTCHIAAQRSEGTIHIPYCDIDSPILSLISEPPQKWLCITKK